MLTDKYASRRYDVEDEARIDTSVLEHIPFEYPGTATDVTYETDEFTSVCPWTGLPDFARLVITYRPSHRLVELKSLKYYLTSFRSVGILQEHAVNRVLRDLVVLLEPERMAVEGFYNDRGGLRTGVRAEYPPR
ncbi:MAG: NADPH-dependent 7-cyano-7-deazaguanine reductase QueF [Chloroflexi bacterium]|nr:NADPH-dependent 7-cyano-7-deazaguanine reductase QueF [Chloroflexota bacterium]